MRFRLYPSAAQEMVLLEQCGHARYVWNLGLEQRLMWRRWKGPTPGFNAQSAQLTEARAAESWLACGSQTVQQQGLRDLDQGWRSFFAGTHRRPRWRRAGEDEGLRIVGPQAVRVRRDNRARSSVLVPKIGWVQFKRSHTLAGWKSYRITGERAGRWHIAFAVIPEPIPAPGVGAVVGVDRGVTLAVALSTGELTSPGGLSLKEAERGLRLQRRLARAARGSNRRRKVRTLIGRVKSRDGDRRKDWAQKTSTDLARRFDVIRLENLNVKGHDPLRCRNRGEPGQERRTEGRPQPGHPQIRLGSARGPVGAEGARSGRESKSCVHVADLTPASTSHPTVARAKRPSYVWPVGTGRTPT